MRSIRLRLLLIVVASLLYASARAEGPIAVIVAPIHADARLDAESLALIFRRKRQYWPDGSRIQPANLPVHDARRIAFSRAVLGADPAALDDYWSEQYFRGIRPPYVVESAEAMLRFVAQTPGAIGYIDACVADRDVAIVGYLDGSGRWHRSRSAPTPC
jgi:ABC-type phosphate transport system substrate-binding protein